jgi:TolB-like protein/DNA-binding winged helix-turn-helix (wHTH) protein/Flp pilus assembly protein TadD
MVEEPRYIYAFGAFRLDPCGHLLTREGKSVPLPPKAFETLHLLVRNAGELIDKDDLMKQLWPGTFVEEGNLTKHVSLLRKALGEGANEQQYIETVPKRGYRFVAAVSETADRAVGAPLAPPTSLPGKALVVPSGSARGPGKEAALNRWPWLLTAALAFAAVGYLGYRSFSHRLSVPRGPVRLAVLPFQNLSGDPQQDFFSDGFTETLITELGQFNELRVISRTSAMHYKGLSKTLPEIARELHVDAVLEGSAERTGDRVRVTAQLIEAPGDRHLWAGRYERDVHDVLRLQDEVAEAIAGEVRLNILKLPGQARVHMPQARAVDSEAYQLYLQGRYFWNKRTAKGLQEAIDYFQRAIEVDPGYAPAYVGLAECYGLLPTYTNLHSGEADKKAIAAATKALEIDSNLAEAYATLASADPNRWDWLEAERQFRRAIQLNPSYATAHQWYGDCLQQMGRLDQATAEYRKAYELDPVSLPVNFVVAYQSYVLRDYNRAIEQSLKLLDMDPNFANGHFELGLIYGAKGVFGKAISEFQAGRSLDPANPLMLSLLGHAYGAAGNRKDAKNVLRDLTILAKQEPVSAFHFAIVHMGLNENDQAFELLNKAWDERYWMMGWLKVDPFFDSLRPDPRFTALVRRMGFPEQDSKASGVWDHRKRRTVFPFGALGSASSAAERK